MKTRQITLVVRIPSGDAKAEADWQQILDLVKPYQSAMGMGDEMTMLEYIEQHEDSDPEIMEEAREHAAKVHAIADARIANTASS